MAETIRNGILSVVGKYESGVPVSQLYWILMREGYQIMRQSLDKSMSRLINDGLIKISSRIEGNFCPRASRHRPCVIYQRVYSK